MTTSPVVSRPFRGPFSRWPRSADATLAVLVLAATLFSGEFEDPAAATGFELRFLSDLPPVAYVIAVLGTLVLYWRRGRPLEVLAAGLVGSILWVGLDYSADPLLSVPFALYSVGRYVVDTRRSYGAVAIAATLIGAWDLFDGGPAADLPADLLVVFLPWYVGHRLRLRGRYMEILEERAEFLEREQAAQAERALAEERSRIARELHDVVAHRVSLMTVQAGAAKTVAADDPQRAQGAMEAVEQAGRQALGELRHLLGVLRPGSRSDGLGPQPGLADLPALIEQVRDAGVEVSFTADGVPADPPAHVDLSAYRIVQEALTNVIKHAGADAQASVHLATADGSLVVRVDDTGAGGHSLPGSGHGLAGMRERAQLLGGSLVAGSRPGGGFQVIARLPIDGGPS